MMSNPADPFRADFASALRSYNAMETTKRRHFDYMTMLEVKKKKFNLSATTEEAAQLEALLRDHHEEVHAFKKRCTELKEINAGAHAAMFEYIGALNKAIAPVGDATSH